MAGLRVKRWASQLYLAVTVLKWKAVTWACGLPLLGWRGSDPTAPLWWIHWPTAEPRSLPGAFLPPRHPRPLAKHSRRLQSEQVSPRNRCTDSDRTHCTFSLPLSGDGKLTNLAFNISVSYHQLQGEKQYIIFCYICISVETLRNLTLWNISNYSLVKMLV